MLCHYVQQNVFVFEMLTYMHIYIYLIKLHRCFGMLLSPGRNVKNSDMHLLDMVMYVFSNPFNKIGNLKSKQKAPTI